MNQSGRMLFSASRLIVSYTGVYQRSPLHLSSVCNNNSTTIILQKLARRTSPNNGMHYRTFTSDVPSTGNKKMHKRSLDEAVAGNSEFAIERELPTPKNKTKEIVLFILASIVTWGIGTQVAFNYQRMTSTAVTTALFSARHNPQIQAIFGNYLDFSSPLTWISGEASNLHGKVDLSFNVKGNGSTGKLFLKSRRQGSGENAKWVTSEFYVLTDDGKKIELSL